MPANINSIVLLFLLLLIMSCKFVLDSNSGENLQEKICILRFILLFAIYSQQQSITQTENESTFHSNKLLS